MKRLLVLILLLVGMVYGQWGMNDDLTGWGMGSGAAEPAWSPADMDSIRYWWRADSLVTECTAESDSVETWTDIISGGVLAYAAGADSCSPTWLHGASGLGGQDAIMGDGIYDRLNCNIIDDTSNYVIWIVCTIPTDNDDPNIVISMYQTTRGIFANWDGAYHRWEVKVTTNYCLANLPADSTEGLAYLSTVTNSKGFYWNGTRQAVSDTSGTVVITVVNLFSSSATYIYPSRLKIAEIGIHNGTVTLADRLLLEAYVKSRYGLTW